MRKRTRSETEGCVPLKKPRVGHKLEKIPQTARNAKSMDYDVEDPEVSFKKPQSQKENVPPPQEITKTAKPSPLQQNNTAPATPNKATVSNNSGAKEEVDERETNRRSPNGFLLPDPLPKGELLADSAKQEWVLGKPIGLGGFGELYLAALKLENGQLSPENYVIKIEPHNNGPLFVEVHFYIRATKPETRKLFKSKQKIKHLGVPGHIANGTHRRKGKKFRFLVMERFGSDLQRILDHSEGGRFTDKTVCEVGMQVLDSLQYIHKQGYVHKDIKAANLLVGLGMTGQHKVHLVDYGLCSRYQTGDIHKQYMHDERWAHEGTLEYTSRDSHIGCTSRRGDIEVLVYNLVEWWGGSLPWDRDIANPTSVKIAKFRAFTNPHKFLRHCFRRTGCNYPQLLNKMMHYIANLRFEDEPDYTYLRGLFRQQMRQLGCIPDGRLEFRLGVSSVPIETEADNLEFLKPLEPHTRVSKVFDRLCVSERTWEASWEEMITRRDEEAIQNPTPAMQDLINQVRERARAKAKALSVSPHNSGHRRRKKSFTLHEADKTEHTPAMLQVMRCIQLRKINQHMVEGDDVDMVEVGVPALQEQQYTPPATMKHPKCKTVLFTTDRIADGLYDEGIDIAAKLSEAEGREADQNPRTASLLPRDLLCVSPIPTEVIKLGKTSDQSSTPSSSRCVTRKSSLNSITAPAEDKRRLCRELSRLDIYLPQQTQEGCVHQMRTRSADVALDNAAMRNLRSAFKFGVTKLFRQVSDSFTSMF